MKSEHRALACRRRVREEVLRALYTAETGGDPQEPDGLPPAALARFRAEFDSAFREAERWDECISPHLAPGWGIERVGLIERLLLRMACWQLWEAPDVPPKVSVSEHVALAKRYVDGQGAAFVNGVLGSIVAASPKAEGASEPASDEGWVIENEPKTPPSEEEPRDTGWTLKTK